MKYIRKNIYVDIETGETLSTGEGYYTVKKLKLKTWTSKIANQLYLIIETHNLMRKKPNQQTLNL